MKAFAVFSLFLLPLVFASSQCPAMSCDYPGMTWSGQVCGQLSGDGSKYTFNSTVCSDSTEYCQFTNFNSDSVCVSINAVPVLDAFPGEKCNDLHGCASGNCVDGVCRQFKTCQNYYDCEGMQYCSSGTCTSLKPAGQMCYHDYECMQNAGCDTVAQGVQGTCRSYLSLSPGTYVLSCDPTMDGGTPGTTNFGRNYMCQSSFCYNFNSGYRCTESFQSAIQHFPQNCTMGSECVSTVERVSLKTYSTPCQCGYNADGQGYCQQLPGDPELQTVLELWGKWLDSDEIMKCNTYSRPTTNQYEWCLRSSGYDGFLKLWYHSNYLSVYPQVVHADSCYLKYVAHSYYLADDAYSSAAVLAVFSLLGLL